MTTSQFDRSISFEEAGIVPTSQRRVRVDMNLCEGHALCIDLAPAVFDLTDDDVATCDPQPSDIQWDNVTAAINACPRGAITAVVQQSERNATP